MRGLNRTGPEMNRNKRSFASLTSCLLAPILLACTATAVLAADEPAVAEWVFAVVDGKEISAAEYDHHARESFRRKFYHGTPPEAELNGMLKEVGQKLIDQALLDQESKLREIKADPAVVAAELEKLERRLEQNPAWKDQRKDALPVITAQLESSDRISRLEKQVRENMPTASEVRAFYDANPALFTQPARNKVSLILLDVPPSSSTDVWEKAHVTALSIADRLKAGEDFAALARDLSAHPTASAGGDMGYMHLGMLNESVDQALAAIKPGEFAGPVRTLEGVVLLRLEDRQPPQLQPFQAVETRARALLTQKRSDARWKELVDRLRAKAKVVIGPAFTKIMAESPAGTSATPAR